MEKFKFHSSSVGKVVPDDLTMSNFEIDRVSTSLVNKSLIHGRDVEKEALVSKLCENNGEGNMSVVSIVGLGGLGKTTLAQLAYNDERVIKGFEKRIWVCVSNTFDECKIARAILEGLELSHHGKDELQTLHLHVQSSLSKHKFLLVLDDVWNEELEKWERLRACLETSELGSRVFVTTRSDKVARLMNTREANMLRPELISEHDCWLLMSHIAFEWRNKDDVQIFENIGREIAKKCKGLPLAAKTLGGLLILKDTIEEWREVLNSEIWELKQAETELFPHLFLSYRELPSTLKCCFMFYSIFPKDFEINVEKLIYLWIAQGYIKPTKQIYDLEQVGQEYFRYLVSRSFFEASDIKRLRPSTSMHDIMHDFALHLSRDTFLTIKEDDNNPEPTSLDHHKSWKAHHLFIEGSDTTAACDVGRLRTCLANKLPRDVTLDMLRHFKLVRSLILTCCSLDQIPQEIGKLIHLRILDLSNNALLRQLPETVGDLYNLRCLFLKHLNLEKFPNSIGKLFNLRLLKVDLEKWKLLAPASLGKLVNLQKLTRVHVEAGSRGLGFLKNLNQLHEDLEIMFDSDYNYGVDINAANLKSKKHMKKLTFDFDNNDVAEVVVDALELPANVKVVCIVNFRGTKLPSWISSHNNLTELEVSSAENIVSLPPLGKFPYLKNLKLHKLSSLKFIGRDFLGIDNNIQNSITFPALEKLKLSHLFNLEKWEDLTVEEEAMTNVMPKLISLRIQGCPKLEVIPWRLLRKASSFLKKLDVDKWFTGEEVEEGTIGTLLPPFPNLQYLRKQNHTGLKLPTWIACLNYLTILNLDGAAKVQSLPPLGKLPFLERLSIEAFSSLEVIGREFLGIGIENQVTTSSAAAALVSSSSSIAYFPKLVELTLSDLGELKEWEDITLEEENTLPDVMPNLKYLHISLCPNLVVLPHRLFHKTSLLQDVMLGDDERRSLKSSSSSFEAVFGSLVLAILKLQDFTICRFYDIKLPSWIISLNYLTDLRLLISKNVTTLPPLGKLPCLQTLELSTFPVLNLVGREFLGIEDDNNQKNVICTSITFFPKLKTLTIYNCKELEVWEDIKPEEDADDAITLMPNLYNFSIGNCPKFEVLPHRVLRRASSLRDLRISGCGIAREKIVQDAELLLRVKDVHFNDENLKRRSEREDNSENGERSPSSTMHCCACITSPYN